MSKTVVGCCITPHGFGHAARVCAVLESLAARIDVCFEIVSTVPAWFFAESLTAPYTLHPIPCDIGLVQHDSLRADLTQTLVRLDDFYPLKPALVEQVAGLFAECALVLCDIAPLGIVAAQKAGIPSVLLENFTWDWIYQQYAGTLPAFIPHIRYLKALYETVDHRIQAEPVCALGEYELVTAPIARQTRENRSWVREQLRVGETDTLVLVTMGGVGGIGGLEITPPQGHDIIVILSGQEVDGMVVRDNLRILPPETAIFHPDLVAACDAVIGKVGYSTLAEVYQAGIPFAYICRAGFRESAPLAAFIEQEMVSMEITEAQLSDPELLELIVRLDRNTTGMSRPKNGAAEAADFIKELL